MNIENEERIYHIICDISKICRNYFYVRKYLPRDFWSEEKDISSLINTAKILEEEFNKSIKSKEEDVDEQIRNV